MKFKEVVLYFEEEKHSVYLPEKYVEITAEYFPVVSVRNAYAFPLSFKVLVDYFESLYYLLAVGTKLSDSFIALFRGSKSPLLKGISLVGYLNVIRGESSFNGFDFYLSDKTPVRILQAGEKTHNLLNAVKETVSYLKEIGESKGELIKKTFYPAVVLIGSVAVTLFTTMYAIPQLKNSGIYSFIGNDKTVKTALDVVEVYARIVPALLVAVLLFFVFFLVAFKTFPAFQKLVQKLPVLNTPFFKGYYVGFRAVSSAVKVGMELSRAFEVASETVSPQVLREEFLIAKKRIEEGLPFSSSFKILSDVEKTLIDNAVKSEFLGKSFAVLSERMKKIYISHVKMIPPFIYTVAIILGITTTLSLIGSVILPYLKMLKGYAQ